MYSIVLYELRLIRDWNIEMVFALYVSNKKSYSFPYLIHNDDEVSGLEEVYLMSDEDARAAAQVFIDAAVEQLPAYVCIHRWQWVVQEVDISLEVILNI